MKNNFYDSKLKTNNHKSCSIDSKSIDNFVFKKDLSYLIIAIGLFYW